MSIVKLYDTTREYTAGYEWLHRKNPSARLVGRKVAKEQAKLAYQHTPTLRNAAWVGACTNSIVDVPSHLSGSLFGYGSVATASDRRYRAIHAADGEFDPVRHEAGILGLLEHRLASYARSKTKDGSAFQANAAAAAAIAMYCFLWLPRTATAVFSCSIALLGACCAAAYAGLFCRGRRPSTLQEMTQVRENAAENTVIPLIPAEIPLFLQLCTRYRSLREQMAWGDKQSIFQQLAPCVSRDDQRMTSTQGCLFSLPTELQLMIAEQFPLPDLLRFAQTSAHARSLVNSVRDISFSSFSVRLKERDTHEYTYVPPRERKRTPSQTIELSLSIQTLQKRISPPIDTSSLPPKSSSPKNKFIFLADDSVFGYDTTHQLTLFLGSYWKAKQQSDLSYFKYRDIHDYQDHEPGFIDSPKFTGGPGPEAAWDLFPWTSMTIVDEHEFRRPIKSYAWPEHLMQVDILLQTWSFPSSPKWDRRLLGLRAALAGFSGSVETLIPNLSFIDTLQVDNSRTFERNHWYSTRSEMAGMEVCERMHPLDIAFVTAISQDRADFLKWLMTEKPERYKLSDEDFLFALASGAPRTIALFLEHHAGTIPPLRRIEEVREWAIANLSTLTNPERQIFHFNPTLKNPVTKRPIIEKNSRVIDACNLALASYQDEDIVSEENTLKLLWEHNVHLTLKFTGLAQ